MKIFEEIKRVRQQERKCTYQILKYLQKINEKKLYCDLGHSNLFKYLVKELDYSENEAYIRISALKLMTKTPLIEKKIKTGKMNLTNATQAKCSKSILLRALPLCNCDATASAVHGRTDLIFCSSRAVEFEPNRKTGFRS